MSETTKTTHEGQGDPDGSASPPVEEGAPEPPLPRPGRRKSLPRARDVWESIADAASAAAKPTIARRSKGGA